ncbi:MAG: universal stress protein [Candidatus Acidiferrales bacterium]|jgi:nucleotide-binding universal stress UspA family protein
MLPPKLIVSPIDFSSHSQEALEVAADLASRFGSQLLLVHAVPALPKLPSTVSIFHEAEYENALRQEAERRLTELGEGAAKKGVQVRTEVGVANDVASEILRFAEHNQADLIIIATHGMTGWHRLAFGSVTEKVVRLASCPVLVLRAQPKAGHEAASRTADSVTV